MSYWQGLLVEPFTWFVAHHEGIASRLPDRAQKWVARRVMREVMASWGFPLDGFTDDQVVAGIRAIGSETPIRDREIAGALYARIRDSRAGPESGEAGPDR